MLKGCVVNVDIFKCSDVVGMSIRRGSADNMVLSPTIDVLSAIIHGGWNFQGDNCLLLYMNVFNYCLYEVRVLQGEHDVMEMIYPTIK